MGYMWMEVEVVVGELEDTYAFIAADRDSEGEQERNEANLAWVQKMLEGRKKGGKEVGRSDLRGVGTEMEGEWYAVWSCKVMVRSLQEGGGVKGGVKDLGITSRRVGGTFSDSPCTDN